LKVERTWTFSIWRNRFEVNYGITEKDKKTPLHNDYTFGVSFIDSHHLHIC